MTLFGLCSKYVMHSHKTGKNGILGKMSFWYHCKEHTFGFNLIPNQVHTPIFRNVTICVKNKVFSSLSGSLISKNQSLRGYCTPSQKLACFVLFLKIIDTFLKKNKVCMHLISNHQRKSKLALKF